MVNGMGKGGGCKASPLIALHDGFFFYASSFCFRLSTFYDGVLFPSFFCLLRRFLCIAFFLYSVDYGPAMHSI